MTETFGTMTPDLIALREWLQAYGEIDRRVAPFGPLLTALDTIPGINRIGAISLLAETGGDMARFPTAAQLGSWAGMCPGHDESAGKRRSGKTRKANRYLRTTLIQAGLSATRKKDCALRRCMRV